MIKDELMLVMGSPPCTLFFRLRDLNKFMQRDDKLWMEKIKRQMQQAKRYVTLRTEIYEHQQQRGGDLCYQHPWLATRWQTESIKKIEECEDVRKVQTDLWQIGTTARICGVGSELRLVLKSTVCFTNSSGLAQELARRCPRDHQHVPLVGGRAAGAAMYPY